MKLMVSLQLIVLILLITLWGRLEDLRKSSRSYHDYQAGYIGKSETELLEKISSLRRDLEDLKRQIHSNIAH